MKLIKLIFYVAAVIVIIAFAQHLYLKESDKIRLRQSTKTEDAEVLKLRCGRRDFISFRLKGKTYTENIYLTDDECEALRGQTRILLKVNEDYSEVVFANDAYNDASPALQQVSTLVLAMFFCFVLIYYLIIPELKKSSK